MDEWEALLTKQKEVKHSVVYGGLVSVAGGIEKVRVSFYVPKILLPIPIPMERMFKVSGPAT